MFLCRKRCCGCAAFSVQFRAVLCGALGNCAPTPAAPVTITVTQGGTTVGTLTQSSATPPSLSLAPGTYSAAFSASGFTTATVGFSLPSGSGMTALNTTLCTGSVQGVLSLTPDPGGRPRWCYPEDGKFCAVPATLSATIQRHDPGGTIGFTDTVTLTMRSSPDNAWVGTSAAGTDYQLSQVSLGTNQTFTGCDPYAAAPTHPQPHFLLYQFGFTLLANSSSASICPVAITFTWPDGSSTWTMTATE